MSDKTAFTRDVPEGRSHRELRDDGQQLAYLVLSDDERAKGFVRPLRMSYIHTVCGTVTSMSRHIAETYARQPDFYTGTFCVNCKTHKPLNEFQWYGTNETVGS